jgi:hypothetical protein
MRETKIHTYTRQQEKIQLCIKPFVVCVAKLLSRNMAIYRLDERTVRSAVLAASVRHKNVGGLHLLPRAVLRVPRLQNEAYCGFKYSAIVWAGVFVTLPPRLCLQPSF